MGDFQLPCWTADAVPDGARLVDVRKRRALDGWILKGAVWVEPETLSFAHPVLQGADPLVFYCVHGHEVSQFAAALALVSGRDARYVRGGYDALVAAGAARVKQEHAHG